MLDYSTYMIAVILLVAVTHQGRVCASRSVHRELRKVDIAAADGADQWAPPTAQDL
jgi:hypothetical protein